MTGGTTYTFTPTLLTVENEAQSVLQTGGKYVYTVDPIAKKLSVEQTDTYDENTDKWYTKSQRSEELKTSLTSLFEPYKLITERPSVTRNEVIAFFKTEVAPTQNEDEIIEYIYKNYKGFGATVDEFKALDDATLSTAIKAVCSVRLSEVCSFYKITASSWTDFMSKTDEIVQKSIKEDFIMTTFEYELVFNQDGICTDMRTNALYDAEKAWHLQYGDYQDKNNLSTRLVVRVIGDSSFYHPGRTDKQNAIIFQDDFMSFKDSGNVPWNVLSDVSAKTITVTGGLAYVLSFGGKSL